MSSERFTLFNGHKIPALFYGTFKRQDELLCLLDCAFTAGYRGIDTAAYYHNEHIIAESLEKLLPRHGLRREDIFITTKLPPKSYGTSAALAALERSRQALKTPYIDLYMIHWPGLQGPKPRFASGDPRGYMAELRRQTWLALETMVMGECSAREELEGVEFDSGVLIRGSGAYRYVRALGISNYLPRHVEEMIEYVTVKPAVIQYEFHPYLSVQAQDRPIRTTCSRIFPNIHYQAHTVLANGSKELLCCQLINDIATRHQKTPAQVILRWSLQMGHGLVINSGDPKHILENAQLFDWELSTEEMQTINDMERNVRLCWDPNAIL